MSNYRINIGEAFRATQLRATPQRRAVLEYLASRRIHATADEIAAALNHSDPLASRATVYNSLNALVAAGLVREVAGEGKAARYDANLDRHHHFLCEQCGVVEDIPWFEVPVVTGRRGLGARVVNRCDLTIRGLCEACAAGKPKSGKGK